MTVRKLFAPKTSARAWQRMLSGRRLDLLDPSPLDIEIAEIALQIKEADKGAAYLEATELAGFAQAEARRLFGRDPGLPVSTRQDYLTPWTAAKAEKRFLARFKALTA